MRSIAPELYTAHDDTTLSAQRNILKYRRLPRNAIDNIRYGLNDESPIENTQRPAHTRHGRDARFSTCHYLFCMSAAIDGAEQLTPHFARPGITYSFRRLLSRAVIFHVERQCAHAAMPADFGHDRRHFPRQLQTDHYRGKSIQRIVARSSKPLLFHAGEGY